MQSLLLYFWSPAAAAAAADWCCYGHRCDDAVNLKEERKNQPSGEQLDAARQASGETR